MALSVIGVGFGRTGTLSLKLALEQLGLGPCHHMREVFQHPRLLRYWQDAAASLSGRLGGGLLRRLPFDRRLAEHLDFWRELTSAYPQAKVILTVRPDVAWWASFSRTIPLLLQRHDEISYSHVRGVLAMSTAAYSSIEPKPAAGH